MSAKSFFVAEFNHGSCTAASMLQWVAARAAAATPVVLRNPRREKFMGERVQIERSKNQGAFASSERVHFHILIVVLLVIAWFPKEDDEEEA
jgi:hypothetical protein